MPRMDIVKCNQQVPNSSDGPAGRIYPGWVSARSGSVERNPFFSAGLAGRIFPGRASARSRSVERAGRMFPGWDSVHSSHSWVGIVGCSLSILFEQVRVPLGVAVWLGADVAVCTQVGLHSTSGSQISVQDFDVVLGVHVMLVLAIHVFLAAASS